MGIVVVWGEWVGMIIGLFIIAVIDAIVVGLCLLFTRLFFIPAVNSTVGG